MQYKFLHFSLSQLLVLCLLFNVTFVVGQLTVTGNSFIYIKNEVLTVNSNINLVASSSRIFLRNESQLLQKGTNSNNQGLGQISIYQNNNVHEFAYNFWCSPVGNSSSSFTNNPFKVNQIHDPLLATPSTIDSQPALFTTGGQGLSSPLTIAKSWLNIFQSGSSLSNWSNVGDMGDIQPGLGFTMKGTTGSNNNQTYDFRGKPNTGTISNNVLASQWTLIGNPYPSALDALQFIHDTENINAITGTLYFWQQDLSVLSHNIQNYVGGYASYTISQDGAIETFIPAPFNTYNSNGQINNYGNTITNITTKKVKRYLPIGQGFMVEGKIGTSGIVKTKNSHREYYKESNPLSEFFKTNQTASNLPSEYSRFRLNIDFNNTYTRQLVQTFHEEATSGFDYGLESKSTNQLSNDGNWIQENTAYASQASVFNENLVLPLGLNLSTNTLVRFRAVSFENIPNNQPIFLYDSLTGLYHNLITTMLEINLNAGNYLNRFDIRFEQTGSLNNTNPDILNSFAVIYEKKNEEIVIINQENLYIKAFELFDLSGKLVISKNIDSDINQFKIPIDNIAKGLYLVNIKSINSSNKIKLIIY